MADLARYDCRYFLGDRPCRYGRLCDGCDEYSRVGTRILVIKLAAAGDVLRATAVLPPLKRKYSDSQITWVADASALPLVRGNQLIDRALPMSFETWARLMIERFDVALSLDKEERAAALLTAVDASEKLGFGLTKWGTIEPVSPGAVYDFRLGLSNDLKFRENKKTYPEIFCEIAGVEYAGDPYSLALPDDSIARARSFLTRIGPAEPLVGLNVGAGGVFANKAWTVEGFAALARRVTGELGGTALVLGGPDDAERARDVLELAEGVAVDGGTHELLDFAAIVGSLDALVTGDTLAMHVAIALGVPVVVIVGPTAPQEITIHGPGRIVVTGVDCAPCYLRACDKKSTCMDAITVDEVFSALAAVLEEA
jgi:ADP-heptose:LPS heptosyltransferase